MPDIKRTEDQVTTADFAERTANLTNRAEGRDAIARENREVEFPGETLVERDARNSVITPVTTTEERVQGAGVATPLLSDFEIRELRSRWSNIQAGFVDEPRRSVEQADQLVATAMQRLAEGFANERASLEKQWDSGDSVSTEDLRLALQRYRTFFGRVLNAA
jgi:hypothetical protein